MPEDRAGQAEGTRQIGAGGEYVGECKICGTETEFVANGGESTGDEFQNHCPSCEETRPHEVTELKATRLGRIHHA